MGFWLIGGLTLAVTFAAAPAVRAGLVRGGVVDRPNHRSSHSVPTPRGGGVACAFGIVVGVLAASVLGHDVPLMPLAAALAVALVGWLDDRYSLPPMPRLVGQMVIGALLGASLDGVAWAVIGAAVMPIIVNVVNFMDGINGIAAMTIAVWGATAVVVGLAWRQPPLALIGVLTLSATIGFLPWNAPRARMFLGDVGSYLLGGLATAGILVGTTGDVPVLALVAPFTVFLADTMSTLFRRAVRGEPLTAAHREHTYQRLVHRSGISHIAVATWATLLAAIVAALAINGDVFASITGGVAAAVLYLGSERLVSLSKRTADQNGRGET